MLWGNQYTGDKVLAQQKWHRNTESARQSLFCDT